MVALAPAPVTESTYDDEFATFDDELVKVVSLAGRAQRYERDAAGMHPALAGAYRRRAAELRLAAWVGALRAGVENPSVVLEVVDDIDADLDDETFDAA
jgi:hypothetical protein